MEYLDTKQIAHKWGISERRVRILCAQGKVPGVQRIGWAWMLPADAQKPADGRTLRRRSGPINRTPMNIFANIDQKKELLHRQRPFPAHTVASLRESLLVEWTYNTNAIEGNTLTLAETKVVLEGITVGGKTMKEHLEAINHREAIFFLEELVEKDANLSEWEIRNLHRLVLKGIDDQNAGAYRQVNVLIAGAQHRPPQPYLIKEQMERMLGDYGSTWQALHPVERAALLHGELVRIHPFIDGNGRTARLLLNFELMKAAYPPVVIKKEQRVAYYEALDLAHTAGDATVFIQLVAGCVEEALDLWLSLV